LRDRKRWGKGKRDFKVNQNLTIYFPLVFPFAEKLKIISLLNRVLMIILIRVKIWSMGFKNIILWFYTPKSLYLMGRLKEKFIVYDIMDEHSKFNGAPKGIDETERRLIEGCNVVFTGTKKLWEAKKGFNSNLHFFPCGVDYSHFAKAQPTSPLLCKEGAGEVELTSINSPIVGYVGAVDDRLDYDLIKQMAELHPEWSIIFIGPFVSVRRDELPHNKNIFYLSGKKYEELPAYMKYFNVCIMPFKKNPLTKKINPTKALEYMAAGKPIVSTPIPDMIEFYNHIIKIGHSADTFIRLVEREINAPDLKGISEGVKLAKERTWERLVESMYGIIKPFLR
jgi:glycosyltransferase involved in cell wall biosynthesis